MKRNIYILMVLALIAAMAASCTKVLDIDDTGAEDLLVLNGVPSAGQRAFVFFSHSHFFLDSNPSHPVDGASPTLRVNGVPYAPDSVSGCKYFFPYVCQPGDTLAIDVTSNAGSVSGRTYVPPFPEVQDFSVFDYASPSWNFYWATYTLHDHPSCNEYYYLTVNVRDSGIRYDPWLQRLDTVDTVHATYFLMPFNHEITSSEVSPNMPLAGYLYSSLYSTDRLIDGQDYPVNLYILHLIDTNEVNDSVNTFKHWYDVTIESITPARWRYLISAAQSMGTISFFAEQAQPYTNIEGGVGVFAGMARWRFTFDPDTLVRVTTDQKALPPGVAEALQTSF